MSYSNTHTIQDSMIRGHTYITQSIVPISNLAQLLTLLHRIGNVQVLRKSRESFIFSNIVNNDSLLTILKTIKIEVEQD